MFIFRTSRCLPMSALHDRDPCRGPDLPCLRGDPRRVGPLGRKLAQGLGLHARRGRILRPGRDSFRHLGSVGFLDDLARRHDRLSVFVTLHAVRWRCRPVPALCDPPDAAGLAPTRAAKRKPTVSPKRTSICLSAEAHKSLRIEALRRDITMSQLIAQALANHVLTFDSADGWNASPSGGLSLCKQSPELRDTCVINCGAPDCPDRRVIVHTDTPLQAGLWPLGPMFQHTSSGGTLPTCRRAGSDPSSARWPSMKIRSAPRILSNRDTRSEQLRAEPVAYQAAGPEGLFLPVLVCSSRRESGPQLRLPGGLSPT